MWMHRVSIHTYLAIYWKKQTIHVYVYVISSVSTHIPIISPRVHYIMIFVWIIMYSGGFSWKNVWIFRMCTHKMWVQKAFNAWRGNSQRWITKVRKYKDKYLINFYWMRSTMSYYGDIIYDCYLLGLESIFVYIRNE